MEQPSSPQVTLRRLPVPLAGSMVYAATRLLSLAVTAFLLHHGKFGSHHVSFFSWVTSWDAHFYLILAGHGYGFRWHFRPLPYGTFYPWFPAYPALMYALGWVTGMPLRAAGFVTTMVSGLAAGAGLSRLGMRLTANVRASLLMVALWSAAPGSTVLSMDYTEALYCALAVWALVALTSQRWLTAAALTIAAGTVQADAAALIVAVEAAALCAVITAWRAGQPVPVWLRPLAAMSLAPLGLLGYLGFVGLRLHRLDAWFWITSVSWHQSFDWGRSTVHNIQLALLGSLSEANMLLVAVIIIAALLAAWSLAEPLPAYLHVYTLTVVALALGINATFLCAKPRYLLPAFLLALPLARRLAPARMIVLIPLIGGLVVVTTWLGLYLNVIANLPP